MKVQENAMVLQRSQLAACAWRSLPNQPWWCIGNIW